jgi:hypothetical protein
MKTFIADIIPKLQKYSQKLDNLTLLTNQHWVVVDEIANSKTVYIFRSNNELLISKNGEVEKAKWEYLGNNSLLLDLKDKSYLFRHGFFDESVLALKIDGKDEYALMVNESQFDKELNSALNILQKLQNKYFTHSHKHQFESGTNKRILSNYLPLVQEPSISKIISIYKTNKGDIEFEHQPEFHPIIGDKAYSNGQPAPDGKYKFDLLYSVELKAVDIKDGVIVKKSTF